MSKKRGKLEIIHDILTVMMEKGEKVRPTHILYKSNLSHDMLSTYLTELQDKGFLKETIVKDKKMYSVTDKGYNFLKDYKLIRGFIESYGLD
ncbi:MAG: winged helix-turn-helix domain-containing protein [Nanoarchaeota archaeon]|nr:winged helix-turn-helix domain-containing protein [Nanoarchaeota archaeon]